MTIAEALVPELEYEASVTRRLLERLPDDKLAWKPHAKSMSLGGLATHLAVLYKWVSTIVDKDQYDMAGDGGDQRAAELTSREQILAAFDANVKAARELIASKSDADLMKSWTLRSGDQVIISMPRSANLRAFILSHSIHHRGQMSVYMRLLDIPVPSIYGPSADES